MITKAKKVFGLRLNKYVNNKALPPAKERGKDLAQKTNLTKLVQIQESIVN